MTARSHLEYMLEWVHSDVKNHLEIQDAKGASKINDVLLNFPKAVGGVNKKSLVCIWPDYNLEVGDSARIGHNSGILLKVLLNLQVTVRVDLEKALSEMLYIQGQLRRYCTSRLFQPQLRWLFTLNRITMGFYDESKFTAGARAVLAADIIEGN